jgi:DASH complex subunit ASK1
LCLQLAYFLSVDYRADLLLPFTAKEASKRIVSDLLATAGGADDLTDDRFDLEGDNFAYGHEAGEEHSPTVVRGAATLEDDTF